MFLLTEGKEETMRLILDSKIDVDQRGNRKKRTALMLASVHGHTHIQETLLDEYHADVNLRSVYFVYFCAVRTRHAHSLKRRSRCFVFCHLAPRAR